MTADDAAANVIGADAAAEVQVEARSCPNSASFRQSCWVSQCPDDNRRSFDWNMLYWLRGTLPEPLLGDDDQ